MGKMGPKSMGLFASKMCALLCGPVRGLVVLALETITQLSESTCSASAVPGGNHDSRRGGAQNVSMPFTPFPLASSPLLTHADDGQQHRRQTRLRTFGLMHGLAWRAPATDARHLSSERQCNGWGPGMPAGISHARTTPWIRRLHEHHIPKQRPDNRNSSPLLRTNRQTARANVAVPSLNFQKHANPPFTRASASASPS
ncbi:hypothetical protein M011DRAFT_456325 [Sporormia fimetaria CBS 119925]|uniref:Secreted protein n=1 Tax=Sporormia fimetaria CBS 119925 TaxID=1340428 RepID=A0A6A6VKX2_9PLEO|nr:hypothetical protein M011DRAFT_456325 [Sporormia fimetaria CBS 119925]